MLWLLLGYLVLGLVFIYGTATIHVIRAAYKYGDAVFKYWDEHDQPINALGYTAGLLIWPVRWIRSILITLPELNKQYELYLMGIGEEA